MIFQSKDNKQKINCDTHNNHLNNFIYNVYQLNYDNGNVNYDVDDIDNN